MDPFGGFGDGNYLMRSLRDVRIMQFQLFLAGVRT